VEELVFYVLAAGAVASALGVVACRNPLFSVLSLLGSFFCLSGIYLLAGFQFLAATQLLVYAGAIMVLFLFVIMLLNLGDEALYADRPQALGRARVACAAVSSGALLLIAVFSVGQRPVLAGQGGAAALVYPQGRHRRPALAGRGAVQPLCAGLRGLLAAAPRDHDRRHPARQARAGRPGRGARRLAVAAGSRAVSDRVLDVPGEHLMLLAALLFAIGILGFLVRRNVIVVLASIELMLNAANLTFLAGSRHYTAATGTPNLDGPIFALFVILVAAVEAAVGLALVIALYRLKQTVRLDAASELKG
jgi:NADH:ubiquinone oxidoreductase subunit K/NADH:ubiquinone oxidoreductase subunit 6 (subunit J)